MSLAVLADPDAHGVVLGRGQGVPLPDTDDDHSLPPDTSVPLRERCIAYVREEPNSTAREVAEALAARDDWTSFTLYRLVLDGVLVRTKAKPTAKRGGRGVWLYRVPA